MEVQAGTFNPADFSWQGLTMTPAAAAHIRDLMRKQPDKKRAAAGDKNQRLRRFWLCARNDCRAGSRRSAL